jgi:hypothetical protein
MGQHPGNGWTTWRKVNPIEVAEYATTKNLHDEPGFAWWVPHVLKKWNIIIAAVTKRYHKHTHKCGIQVPKTWGEAVKLDEENGNTLWKDALRKEMNNVRISFKVLNGDRRDSSTCLAWWYNIYIIAIIFRFWQWCIIFRFCRVAVAVNIPRTELELRGCPSIVLERDTVARAAVIYSARIIRVAVRGHSKLHYNIEESYVLFLFYSFIL